MTIKIKRTVFPPELDAAVAVHAAALVAGDDQIATKFAGDRAAAEYGAAMKRAASMRPFSSYDVIARARLGFQYLVKLRLHGSAGDLNLQNRWREVNGGDWRVVEIEDLGLRSPWKKPAPDATLAEQQRRTFP